jgi:hypothetical protein
MNRKLAFVLFGASIASAALAAPAVSLSGATAAETSNVLLGWTFSPNTDVYVTGLGYVDLGDDGMATSHQIGIFDVVANSLVTSATLAAGTASTKLGDFRYADADGAKLSAGKRYMIVGTDDSDAWTTNLHSTATFASEIVPDGGAYFNYDNPNTLRMATDTFHYQQYFGPSFTYSTQAVPEPASMAALGLGALGVLRRRKGR